MNFEWTLSPKFYISSLHWQLKPQPFWIKYKYSHSLILPTRKSGKSSILLSPTLIMIKYTLLLLYIRFRSPEIHHKLREVLRRCAHFAMAINDKLVDWADIGHFHTVYVWCEWINNRTFPIHIIIISITFLFYCFVNDNSDMGVRQSSNNVCGHSVMKNNLLHVYCTSFASQTPCNNRLYSLIYTDRDMRIVQE